VDIERCRVQQIFNTIDRTDTMSKSIERLPIQDESGTSSISRRTVLMAGGAAIAASAVGIGLEGGAIAQSTPTSSPSLLDASTCVLTPELTEGPYYLALDLIRQNIIEDREGIPLKLQIAVADATACTPIENAAVDIWHCDSHGYYSGVSANMPGPDADQAEIAEASTATFLRGIQLTNADGIAEFETIYPGWYIGRTIHIHLKVHLDGEAGKTYEGGHTTHTGQLFFDDATTDQLMLLEPYAGRPDEYRTLNESDGILSDHIDEPGFFVTLTELTEGKMEDGFLATIVIGIDPSAEYADGAGGGGGPQGGQGGPNPPSGSPGSGGSGSTPDASS
jgi:protocatechuate 3,4-dioxygenase beta subunit